MTARAIGAAVEPPVPALVLEDDRDRELRGRALVVGSAKAMNQVVFAPGTPVSPVPVLPPTDQPGICAAVPVPLATPSRIIPATASAVDALTAWRMSTRSLTQDDAPVRRDDPAHDLRLHEPSADTDRARDHRHLQRRHEHPLLPERHAARVDVGFDLRVVEPPVVVEAARRAARRRASRAAGARRSRSASRCRGSALRRAPCRCCRRPSSRSRRARPRGRVGRTGCDVSKLFTRLP